MTVINVSRENINNEGLGLYDKIRTSLKQDLYYASSLSALEKHFRNNSLSLKDRIIFGGDFAFAYLRDLEVRLIKDSQEINSILPVVWLKSLNRRTLAYIAGGEEVLSEYAEDFGLNENTFVTTPITYLFYRPKTGEEFYIIKGLFDDKEIEEVKDVEPLPLRMRLQLDY